MKHKTRSTGQYCWLVAMVRTLCEHAHIMTNPTYIINNPEMNRSRNVLLNDKWSNGLIIGYIIIRSYSKFWKESKFDCIIFINMKIAQNTVYLDSNIMPDID